MSFAFAGDDVEAKRASSGSRVETDPDVDVVCSRAQRNIEIGRVALCNLKADKRYGKLLVIVDIIDQNRVRVMVERRVTAGC